MSVVMILLICCHLWTTWMTGTILMILEQVNYWRSSEKKKNLSAFLSVIQEKHFVFLINNVLKNWTWRSSTNNTSIYLTKINYYYYFFGPYFFPNNRSVFALHYSYWNLPKAMLVKVNWIFIFHNHKINNLYK